MEMAVSSTAMTIFRKWYYFLLFDNIPSAMYKFATRRASLPPLLHPEAMSRRKDFLFPFDTRSLGG
jgi:hypothetical protein